MYCEYICTNCIAYIVLCITFAHIVLYILYCVYDEKMMKEMKEGLQWDGKGAGERT